MVLVLVTLFQMIGYAREEGLQGGDEGGQVGSVTEVIVGIKEDVPATVNTLHSRHKLVKVVRESPPDLHVGKSQREHLSVWLVGLDCQVSALEKWRQRMFIALKRMVEDAGGTSHGFQVCNLYGWHLFQHVDESAGCGTLEPVVAQLRTVEGIQQAEGVIHVRHAGTEVE